MDTPYFVVEPSEVPWKSLALDGGGEVQLQMYLKGRDGGPEAIRARISEGYEVEPHFHLAAQFQLLLDGRMKFPTFQLEAPAVHYTEHNVPYGPFIVSREHDMLVLHTKPGGVIMMRDKERRRQANTRGREITCCAHEVEWEPLPGYAGARRKILIPASQGPSAEILECPAGMEYMAAVPTYGRYEVVLSGSAEVDGKSLGPKSLRFVAAGEQTMPLKCGPEGVTLIVLTYDQDAAESYGGSTAEVIAEMEK
ncbi:MAG: hypothetical protein HY268_11555 [Deltaproteobacteria bacterium]|nr:hypothetical protein [Deltaproteobacteria bacterium]